MAASNSPAEQLITENIDIWTSAIKKRGSQGRGSSKKIELYGIKKLRELILELAVRGLLVPQDPNDEPASVLLEKVAAEKEQLIKDGKIKKQKALPEISEDEKPFELPLGWEWMHFGRAYELEYGNNLPQAKRSNSGEYPVYGSNGIVGTHNEYCVENPCIVVGRKGSAGALNLENGHGCWVTDVAYSITPPTSLLLRFVLIQLHTLGLESLGKGIKPGLNRNEAYKLCLAFPPEAEQPRIVAKVDELMALCDQLEQQTESSLSAHQTLVETLLNTLLNADQNSFDQAWERIAQHFDVLFTTEHSIDQLKQTILQLAVMGKLVPQDPNDEPASVLLEKIAAEKEQLIKNKVIKKQKTLPPIGDDEKPFELPVGWKWVRLGSIISLISGQHLKPSEYFETKSENAVPYITGPAEFGVLNPTYSKFTNEKRALAEDGDILITCKGSGLGKWNIAHETIAISRQLMAIRPINLDEEYLRLIIDSKYELFQSKGVGIAIPGISREDITEVLIGLPSEAELHRITEKVSKLMLICIGLKDRIRKSQTTQIHLADVMAEQALL